jgi:hypothetical protein
VCDSGGTAPRIKKERVHATLFPLAIKIRYDKLDVPACLFSPQALLLAKLLRHAHEYAKINLTL